MCSVWACRSRTVGSATSPTAVSPMSKALLLTFQTPQQRSRGDPEMTLMSTRYRKLVWCILPALVASVLVLVGSSVVAAGQQRGPRRPGAAPLIPGNGPRDFDAQGAPANP